MTISPCFEVIIPIVKQAQNVIGSRSIHDSLKLVRQFSSLKVNANEMHPSVSCSGVNGMSSTTVLTQDLPRTHTLSVRTICGRENCADPCDFPRCTPENLAKTECMKKKEEEKEHKATVYELYWNRPECCNNECAALFPRFDDLYYRESDKENRIYTQTWAECPPVVVKPRHICCTDKINLPPLCKRPKAARPKTACGHVDVPCSSDDKKCPRIRLPCCAAARTTPCKVIKLSSGCKKFNAPSPSFSECRKPEFKRPRISECWCLAAPSMCQVWTEWRRLQLIKRQ